MVDVHTFLAHCTRRFGTGNPTRIDNAFWHHMVRTGERAIDARNEFEPERGPCVDDPVWCFNRFGPSRTPLPDGTIVCIGGEHEDYYDPDFCIYNDVIVIGSGGRLSIFGYPREVFPPIDFHTADLCGDRIIIVGGLGYVEDRGGPTPVFSLDLANYSISRLHPTGPSPGWIYKHKSQLLDSGRVLRIHGGRRIEEGPAQKSVANSQAADLLLTEMIWKPAPAPALEEPSDISLPYPWKAISRNRERSYLIDELRQQVPIGHPLFAVNVDPVAEDDSGKLLFRLRDGSGRFACVELELMEERHAALPKPLTKFYESIEEFIGAEESR